MPYRGWLALDGEDQPIRAEIEFGPSDLSISVDSGQLGSWPASVCRIETDGHRFLLDVDGDVAWFDPDDRAGFAQAALAHLSARGLASAVKTARLASAAPPPTEEKPAETPAAEPQTLSVWWNSLNPRSKNLALVGGGVTAAMVVIAAILARPAPPPAQPLVITTSTTLPPAAELDLAGLSMRWNEVAADLGLDLFILGVPSGNRMEVPLGSGIVLYATEDPHTREVRTVMVSTGPAEGEQAQAVLATWGTLIAMLNPELTPEERRQVLDRLGVDVERPLQLGLATETEENGVRYWLRSGVLGGRVLLGAEVIASDPPE